MKCSAKSLFLLTPLREGRRSSSPARQAQILFLLTPLREGRPRSTTTNSSSARFLLTPLREGRRSSGVMAPRTVPGFLLTPLREGRQPAKSWQSSNTRYFYSRPCGRGDAEEFKQLDESDDISTHAPAGGATSPQNSFPCSRYSFLLTPLREGRREIMIAVFGKRGPISTHAPAGGATARRSQI